MTDQLQGSDLSRAVARALGWTSIRDVDGVVYGVAPGAKNNVEYVVPWYATDPARIPELLAWLRLCGAILNIEQNRDFTDDGRPIPVDGWVVYDASDMDESGQHDAGEGATLNEALCRLVLALVEARGAKP